MKALLWKDRCVFGKQFYIIALLIVCWGIIPSSFLNGFSILYGALLPCSAMAYDERSHWEQLARMLPYRDRDVVLSKYVLGWSITLASAAFVLAAQGLLHASWGAVFRSAPQPGLILTALCAEILMLDLNIPLMLRFGVESGRLASLLTIFLTCAVAGGLGGLSSAGDMNFSSPGILAPAAILAIAGTTVSLPLSLRFYRRRAR